MGALRSKLGKPFRNYNIESRAHRELDRQQVKPVVAPRHKQPIASQGQHILEESAKVLDKKDEHLHEMLKTVRVDSIGPALSNVGKRALPERITHVREPEYGVTEPKTIPPGKLSIRQALDIISQHQANPEVYNAAQIAKEYKLELYSTQQILKHFQTFHLHIPKKMQERFPHLLSTLKEQVSYLGSERQRKLLDIAKRSSSTDSKIPTESIEKSS